MHFFNELLSSEIGFCKHLEFSCPNAAANAHFGLLKWATATS
jgi:hypothetical protein